MVFCPPSWADISMPGLWKCDRNSLADHDHLTTSDCMSYSATSKYLCFNIRNLSTGYEWCLIYRMIFRREISKIVDIREEITEISLITWRVCTWKYEVYKIIKRKGLIVMLFIRVSSQSLGNRNGILSGGLMTRVNFLFSMIAAVWFGVRLPEILPQICLM